MSFKKRQLTFQFNLGKSLTSGKQQNFTEGGDQLLVSGDELRATASISIAGGLSMGRANIAIYGMTLSQMNQLSTLGINPLVIGPNFITVQGGEVGGQLSTIFQGSITNAWMDGDGMPNVPFRVEAHAGLYQGIAPCPPRSFPGAVSVVQVLSGLATQMGLAFENTGVDVMLPPGSYYYGSARNQAYAAAKAARINILIDPQSLKLAIWPMGKARGGSVPLISPTTGMQGYPTYTSKGIEVRTLYNPSISFGSNIKVESSLTPASGTWNVYSLEHQLESSTPGGAWYSIVRGAALGSSTTTPGVQTAIPE